MIHNQNNRFIITGSPGSGKTSLIKELRLLGYNTQEEVARKLIKKNLTENLILPWKNRIAFDSIAFIELLGNYLNHDQTNICFFDGGIPDIIAYQNHHGLNPINYLKIVKSFPYERTIIIPEPWKEIYEQDELRPWTFKESQNIHSQIVNTYEKLGYSILNLKPGSSIGQRIKLVEQNI